MKAFACLLLVSACSASYIAPYQYDDHSYDHKWTGEYAPLGLIDGRPIDTHEVQHARQAHFATWHKIASEHAQAHHGHGIYKRSIWGYAAPWGFAAAPAPVNGVPVDTPEVAHAKAAHFAAHSKALAGQYASAAHYGLGYNGAPVETPEVQHAKAAHFAAHAKAGSYIGSSLYPQHIPVIKNGVPVDTPEVQHAKAAHFAAVAKAQGHGYAPSHSHSYYPQHIPVIKNGVPVDTPEVQHAKAAHFAALAKAKSSSWDEGHSHWDQY